MSWHRKLEQTIDNPGQAENTDERADPEEDERLLPAGSASSIRNKMLVLGDALIAVHSRFHSRHGADSFQTFYCGTTALLQFLMLEQRVLLAVF
jgi:hypothetical protein